MSSSSSSPKKVSLKLLIDTNTERVLFAEATKDFIDLLFNLYRMPIGTFTSLITNEGMVGSLGKFYKSIQNLNDYYMVNPNRDIDLLLKPIAAVSGCLLPSTLYMCPKRCENFVTNSEGTLCPSCNREMAVTLQFVTKKAREVMTDSSSSKGGGVETYMVMDDLEVQPMSPIYYFTLLEKFNIEDVSGIQKRVVELGTDEGIKLLKASLQHNNHVLTNVFLH
ncbi:uncharacterized protein LOC114730793 [Neltuma alba]|uniref:uncharacterized protein LOC114730793 n=1 Tax=Neltuma alba TaxID=207710 RepID=UPI0010A45E1F|nr:uncharacterized protein LOC114730793 [Prosopis alba]